MLPLVVERITSESSDIVSIELVDPSGALLPAWAPGAHIDVQLITRHQRQYSLCGDPADLRSYRIAVLREEFSRGASMYIHDYLSVGRTIYVAPPRNLFPVLPSAEYLLLAAGIGITPILPMAKALAKSGSEWSMHVAVQDDAHLPFRDELTALGDRVTINSRDRAGRLDLTALLAAPRPGLTVYTCGPARFTDAVTEAMLHWPANSLHLERFEPKVGVFRPNAEFTLKTARSGLEIPVPPYLTTLQALNAAGVPVTGSCVRGVCGSCAIRVVGGKAEHRDSLTTDEDSTVMYPCVSRSLTDELVVDL